MTYTAPAADAADFHLQGHTPPAGDAANFDLTTALRPRVTQLDATTPPPGADVQGTATVAPEAVDIDADALAPAATGQGTVTVSADAVSVSLAAFLPGVSYSIAPPAAELSLSDIAPTLASGSWLLDGEPLETVTSEVATSQTWTLVIRADDGMLTEKLRDLKADQGKANVLATDDGGFVAVDRANGSNTFRLTPPISRQPLRQPGDRHVSAYEESMVTQTTDEWDVELELVKASNREDAPSISETPAADEWGFGTRYGTIATDRVDAEFAGTGESGVERFELTTRLTFDQSHAFEAALSQLGGVRVREVPDGDNVAVDDTAADAGTLTIDAPDAQDVVSDGEYVVIEWASRRLNDAAQEVEFVIASA